MKKLLVIAVGLVVGLVLGGRLYAEEGKTCTAKAEGKCTMAKCEGKLMVCPKCGEQCKSDKCCKEGAVKCEKCGLCWKKCPVPGAIAWSKGEPAVIHDDVCVACGRCVVACPPKNSGP